MTEPSVYLAIRCPDMGESRYSCKVLGQCDCGKDDDMFRAFERQSKWRAARIAPPMRDEKGNP